VDWCLEGRDQESIQLILENDFAVRNGNMPRDNSKEIFGRI